MSVVCVYRSAVQTTICNAQLRDSPKLHGSVRRRTLHRSWRKLRCPHGETKKSLPECQGTQGGVSRFKISLLWFLDKSWYSDNELECQRNISRGLFSLFIICQTFFTVTGLNCGVFSGGVLSLCGSRRLLESYEGVHAVLPGPQCSWVAICICN